MPWSRPVSKVFALPRATALLLAAFLLCPSTLAKNKYKKWLEEEVCWIISKAEAERFEGLKDDAQRDEFIAEFWRRRDPTPATERNEYKVEHYRRLVFAKKMFREGIPGWKTDRGRVYILHGPPDRESFFNSKSTISPTREIAHTMRNPNTIVWIYHQNLSAKYYRGEMRLIFQPSTGLSRQNFVLSESKTAQDRADQLASRFFPASDPNWLEADVRYKLVMAGPPAIVNSKGAELPSSGLAEANRYMEDFLRSPGDLLDERQREIQRREQAKEELRTSAQTEISFGTVAFDLNVQSFYLRDDDWMVPLRLKIDLEGVSEPQLDVYAALLDGQGQVFDEFIDSIAFDPAGLASAEANIQYFNSFTAASGDYRLRVAVREVSSKKTGFKEQQLDLSPQFPDKTTFGSVMLTNRVELVPENESELEEEDLASASKGIVFNNARLLHNPSMRFYAGDYLFLFLQIWPCRPDSKISLNTKFIRDGQIVGKLDPRTLEPSEDRLMEYGMAVPLENFAPGQYTLQFQAVDFASKTFDIARVPFKLLEPPTSSDENP